MEKLYRKSELTFAIMWIVIYCVLQSVANELNKMIGIAYLASAVLAVLQLVILALFIRKTGLAKRYGLCQPTLPADRFLWYIPLAAIVAGGLCYGVGINYPIPALISRVVCMLCVGFIEELIFRGFLFRAMAKDGLRSAIVVSSLTFGIGHIINLMNGSNMDLVTNLCQIGFAISVGFLFVTIFYRSGSLIPCIIGHSAINVINTFAVEASPTLQIIQCVTLMLVTIIYALIIVKKAPPQLKIEQKTKSSHRKSKAIK